MRKRRGVKEHSLKMEPKLQLCIWMLLIQDSLAVWQRITVMKGQTVELRCPVTNTHQTNVEWKNPDRNVMFFQESKVTPGVREKRYSVGVSESEFTISISDVTFKDGGNYTCYQYHNDPVEKTVEVTVLGHPTITKTVENGAYELRCKAEANHHAPQIFWKFENAPEILAHSQIHHEGRKYTSNARLSLHSVENRTTVKCLVRHPALYSRTLMDFIKIGRKSRTSHRTTTAIPPTAKSPWTTQTQRTTGWLRSTGTHVMGPSSEYPITTPNPSNQPKVLTASTGSPLNPLTSTGSRLSTSWAPQATEETALNQTDGNRTGIFNDPKKQTRDEGNQSLLIFLVTCLIVALLVVVIFFGVKLRRAHIIWKRENEDSDPSEESSKSKSSQEEKNSQGQKRRGIFNTAFTQYVAEKPPRITSVINTAAMAAMENTTTEQASQPQTSVQTSAKCDIKETEL